MVLRKLDPNLLFGDWAYSSKYFVLMAGKGAWEAMQLLEEEEGLPPPLPGKMARIRERFPREADTGDISAELFGLLVKPTEGEYFQAAKAVEDSQGFKAWCRLDHRDVFERFFGLRSELKRRCLRGVCVASVAHDGVEDYRHLRVPEGLGDSTAGRPASLHPQRTQGHRKDLLPETSVAEALGREVQESHRQVTISSLWPPSARNILGETLHRGATVDWIRAGAELEAHIHPSRTLRGSQRLRRRLQNGWPCSKHEEGLVVDPRRHRDGRADLTWKMLGLRRRADWPCSSGSDSSVIGARPFAPITAPRGDFSKGKILRRVRGAGGNPPWHEARASREKGTDHPALEAKSTTSSAIGTSSKRGAYGHRSKCAHEYTYCVLHKCS